MFPGSLLSCPSWVSISEFDIFYFVLPGTDENGMAMI